MDPQKTTVEPPSDSQAPSPHYPEREALVKLTANATRLPKTPTPKPLSYVGLMNQRPSLSPEEQAARNASILANDKARDEEMRKNVIRHNRDHLARKMGRRYTNCSLKNFAVSCLEQKNALETVVEFMSDVQRHVEQGRGLILYGTVGTGKDHLLAACLLAAVETGFVASWCNAQSVYEAARDNMDKGGREYEMMKAFVDPLILGVSDPVPPAGELTGFRIELLWRITDIRYREVKPIWMTLNANSLEECQAKLSVPLWDRLQDNAVCVPCFWPSFRKAKAK